MGRTKRWAPKVLAGMFVTSGVIHMVKPEVFTPIVPHALPGPTGLVYVSGIAELICAAGLLRGARWAGPASVLVLLAVYPANIQMAVDVLNDPDASDGAKAAVLLRLPLQFPMIWAALQHQPRRRTPELSSVAVDAG